MEPSDPVVITVTRGSDIIMEAEGSYDIRVTHEGGRTKVTIRDCRSDNVLCDDLPIYNMTINTPFIYIQTQRS